MPKRGSRILFMVLFVRGVLAAWVLLLVVSASADPASSLRQAITELMNTYGAEYAEGQRFLERLEEWERTSPDKHTLTAATVRQPILPICNERRSWRIR
jgi:hypothetical protein